MPKIYNQKFYNALNRIEQKIPPIWLMRQAGRYHKHYQNLKKKGIILRSTETEDEINKRLSRFEEEDNLKKEFDYNLINDNFETTFEKIKEIININKKED